MATTQVFFTKKRTLLIVIVLAVAVLLFIVPRLLQEKTTEPHVVLETHSIESDTDTDKDGVPDWLEDLTNSDSLDASSFPYQKDIAQAKNITVNDLLYDGPGEFTEEIVRRFLLQDITQENITQEEKDRFIDTSADYFIRRVEERGLPTIQIQIDDTVSRAAVLDDFLLVMRRFSEESRAIEQLVFELFAKNNSITPDAERVRSSCNFTLKNIPRSVPGEIYDPYYILLERITNLCEAVAVASIAPTTENYFYILRLLTSGRIYEEASEPTEEAVQDVITDSFNAIVTHLRS